MQKILILLALLAAGQAGAAHAQEATPGMDHSAMAHGDATELPPACQTAGAGAEVPAMPTGMDNLDPVQKANHDAMLAMHAPMMQAAMIKDADLAFNCGMIAHHRGAIAMAKVELAMGKDEASRKLARAIIDAQEKEIADMTAWVEERAN